MSSSDPRSPGQSCGSWRRWLLLVVVVGAAVGLSLIKSRFPRAHWLTHQSLNLMVCALGVWLLAAAVLLKHQRVRPGPWAGASPALNVVLAVAALSYAVPQLMTGELLGSQSRSWQRALLWLSTGGFAAVVALGARLGRARGGG